MLASPTSPGIASPPESRSLDSRPGQSGPEQPESKRALDAGAVVVATVVAVSEAVRGAAVVSYRRVADLPVMSIHVVWLNRALVEKVERKKTLRTGQVLRPGQRVDGR